MLFFHLALDTPVGEDGENTIGDLAADSFDLDAEHYRPYAATGAGGGALAYCRVTFGATGGNNPVA